MAAIRFRHALLVCIEVLTFPVFALADDSLPARTAKTPSHQVVRMRLAGQEGIAARKLGNGNGQRLEPCQAPQERLLQEPKYKSNRPIYYAARCGDGKDPIYSFVLDESNGPEKGYDAIYIDADNDNRIDAEKERFPLRLGASPQAEVIRIRLQATSGGVTAPYYVSLSAFEYCDEKFPVPNTYVTLRDSSYYLGEAIFGGKTCRIAVADLNSNGLFSDVEQDPFQGGRFFVALDEDSQLSQSFPYGGFKQIAGQWYSIVASPDGGRVEITAAQPPLGTVEVSAAIAGARLNSPTQPLDLEFEDGSGQALAGTYRVHSVYLLSERGWALSGSFPDGEPELTVRAAQSVRLAVGLPLKVEPQVVADDDRTLRISLRITGTGGETYDWSSPGGSSSKAGFEILDPSDRRIASAAFEYG